MNNVFKKIDVRVFDKFLDKFAEKYIEQRTALSSSVIEEALKVSEGLGTGFDLSQIKSIVKQNAVYIDPIREKGDTPDPVNDIYRSDLGELLTTYYFEEKLDDGQRYIIPAKNISTRERYDMPGRGIDAIGYRIKEDGTYELLIAEAKVSGQKQNPPAVVDQTSDSIYKTHKKYHDNSDTLKQRLVEFSKNLDTKDVIAIMFFVISLENKTNNCEITYGCGLVRDYTCVDETKDYGKMQSNANEFDPGNIHFAILSFTEETIDSTIDLFYKKVQELTK
ncbi:MAG: DUF1837 domain-containing protein [Bacteroidales bacterium]|nr:DUF1837 domain-containing protein [Bacteroidales bacterium]